MSLRKKKVELVDRTIASVTVWPVFIVHFKLIFLERFYPGRQHGHCCFVQYFAGWNIGTSLNLLLHRQRKRKLFNDAIRTVEQLLTRLRKSDPVGLLLEDAESEWRSFYLFDFFFSLSLSCVQCSWMGGRGRGTLYTAFHRWSGDLWRKSVWGRKRVLWCQCSPSLLHWH